MSGEERGRGYPGIDIFRVAAAFLVAAIHVSPLAKLTADGDFLLVSVAARVAVPFFFMTSGFFTVTRYAADSRRLWKFVGRTVSVYLLAVVLYLPVNIYNGYFTDSFTLPGLLRDLAVDGTMYHLWYMPAAALGAVIAWYLIRRHDYPAAFAVTGLLYLVGVFGDSWYGAVRSVPGLSGFYSLLFQCMDRTRNGLFFAPLFFVLGARARDGGRAPRPLASGTGLAVSLVIMGAEALLLRRLDWARYYTMYLTLPVCAFFLFDLLRSFRGPRHKTARSFATLVYILHPLAILGIRLVARPLGLWELLVENNLIHFLAVCAATAAVSLPAAVLLERVRRPGPDRETCRAWRVVDAGAVTSNVAELRKLLPEGSSLMAVVKANAYGHGDLELARLLERDGVRAWAVATADEGIALRRYGIHGEILVLGYTDPGRAGELKKYRLTQTVVSREHADALNRQGAPLRVHLKIDTGMHRLGIPWDDTEDIAGVFGLKNLRITGMFTHLACSESREAADAAFTGEQGRRFAAVARALRERGITPPAVHIQSTYGMLNYPELTAGYVRVGLGIYGVLSDPEDQTLLTPALRPALSLYARVALVRRIPEGEGVGYGGPFRQPGPRRIAILPIGYGDGYLRELSGGVGYVLLHGRKAPVAGAVCMDQMAVDVTDIPDVAPGDTATLIGRDGQEEITAPELAKLAGTITNDLLSGLGTRLGLQIR